jgi:glycine oxidase
MLKPGQPVSILGAGLMGRLMGLLLLRAGHPVDLHDSSSAQAEGAAAWVAAAMLAPLAESAVTEPSVVAMGCYALARWEKLLASLAQPVFFQRQGTLVLWHRQDRAEAKRFQGLLGRTLRQMPNLPRPVQMADQDLSSLEPALGDRFSQGLYLPSEGQLDNRGLLVALLSELHALGARLHWHSPADPETLARRNPDHLLLDCRGLGARPQWQGLRGVRGEVIRVHAPDVPLRRPTRLIHPRYPIYIAPKPGHIFVIGATEIESDDGGPASVRSTLELLSAAYTVHPGFGEARILELNTQCRPTLGNNLPAIRQEGPQLLRINGLYRHGFMIAPAVADAAMQWLTRSDLTLCHQFALLQQPPAAAVQA